MSIESVHFKFFEDLTEQELLEVLEWRNHPEIRRWMVNKNLISLEEHKAFIQKLKRSKNPIYVRVEDKGVVNFHKKGDEVEIGLHKNPSRKGVGSLLLSFALNFCQERLQARKVIVKVFKHNKKAIDLYRKYGFYVCDQEDEMVIMEQKL